VRRIVAGQFRGWSQTLEERQERVRWKVAPRRGADRSSPVERFLFQSHVSVEIDVRGGGGFVAQPQRDDGGVDSGVQ
jgi:hypothetical protein